MPTCVIQFSRAHFNQNFKLVKMNSNNLSFFEGSEYNEPFPTLNFDTHCRSCNQPFDCNEHLPKCLTYCRHTLCLKCLKDSHSSATLLLTCFECKVETYQKRIVQCLETNKQALFMSQEEIERNNGSGSWCVACGSFAQFSCQPEHNTFTLSGGMLKVGKLLVEASNKLKEAVTKRLQVLRQLKVMKLDSNNPIKVLLEAMIQENDTSLTILRDSIESFKQTNDAFLEKNTDHEVAKEKLQNFIQMAKQNIFSSEQITNHFLSTFPRDLNSNVCVSPGDVGATVIGNVDYQIFVKLLCGVKIKTLKVKCTDTIQSLKEQLMRTENLAVNRQWLMYAGRPLEDDKPLSFYNIYKEATLDLHVRWNVDHTPLLH